MQHGAPRRVLLLRPIFGALAGLFHEIGATEIEAIEVSETALLVTQRDFPYVRFIDGEIHGELAGCLPAQEPYDCIVSLHTLQHVVDLRSTLTILKGLLRPGAMLICVHEIGRKPHNPFHMNHLSEYQLRMILATIFPRIERIADCDADPPEFITSATEKGDSPDLAAFNARV
jgi:2-polyprenyl-3-methyl-5-hydroxy-6-metoxy-1,4-benzoquinol methylase